jgi:hypothetical protein
VTDEVRASPRAALKDGVVHVHLRLPAPEAELLHRLAEQRDQTISGLVRSLLRRLAQASSQDETPETQMNRTPRNRYR